MPVSFQLNGHAVTLDVDPEMPLLWAIREQSGLTGTKFGCGIASCRGRREGVVAETQCRAVRLLPVGSDHVGGRAPHANTEALRHRYQRRHER